MPLFLDHLAVEEEEEEEEEEEDDGGAKNISMGPEGGGRNSSGPPGIGLSLMLPRVWGECGGARTSLLG